MPTPLQLDRRKLLKSLAYATAASTCAGAFASEASLHGPLPAWAPGHFDIHHIDTGRGNSTLLIFPDGTSMMVDAGAVFSAAPGTLAPERPNEKRSPGEWEGLYTQAFAPAKHLDYFLATHIHDDHVDGLADVDARMPINTCIDRAFPNYAANQLPSSAPFAQVYLEYLRKRIEQGRKVEAAQVGSITQVALRNKAAAFPSFRARILSANGNVWNRDTDQVDPLLVNAAAATDAHGNENLFSTAIRFEYGPFSYFTGGDLTFDTNDGRHSEFDIESPVVRSAGRTEVALADHHGYFDACGPNFTNTLDAQAYIIPSWDIGHPGSAQMQHMMGAWDNKAHRDVFALELLPANALLNRRFSAQLKSQQGHVVVRVAPGGNTYTIYTLESTTEQRSITGIFGPYTSRV